MYLKWRTESILKPHRGHNSIVEWVEIDSLWWFKKKDVELITLVMNMKRGSVEPIGNEKKKKSWR